MQGYLPRRPLAAAMALVLAVATTASAGEILSTMRNVNAVAEAHGFRLNMVHDVEIPPLQTDLSPAQAFEILRPGDKPVTVGRLFTSCSCIQLESPKRTFNPGERAVLTLRNIRPTPPAGQVYAVFVQITSPVRTTLRFDTYVQSGMAGGMPFENPATGLQAGAAGQQQPAASLGADPLPGGPSHADAVAALTRQIDQGLAAATSRTGTASMAAPAPTAASAEARELPPLPTTAVQTPAAAPRAQVEANVEAREMPAPLPPPAELTAQATAASQPPAGVAVVPGAAAQPTAGQLPPPTQLPRLPDVAAVPSLAVPPLGGASEATEVDEEDEDDFNPLLNPPPGPVVSQAVATQAQPVSNTLTMDELERELKNDVDELESRQTVNRIPDDEELSKAPEEEDLGTADLVMDLRDLPDFYSQPAPTTSASAPVPTIATATATTVETAAVTSADDYEEDEDDFEDAAPAQTAYVAGNALPPPTVAPITAQIQDTLTDDQMRLAVDSLPPPPGLTAPAGANTAEVLTAREVATPVVSEETAYVPQQIAPIPAPVVPAQVLAAPAPAYDEGIPEPRPERDPSARKPVQAVSLITVGVRDMPSSIRFYEALGWRRAGRGKYDQTAFFQLQGQILALYPMHELLSEQNMPNAAPSPGGITLALHVQDRADVWSVYQRFIDAGGSSLRPPAEMASGAVTSYVADPDGNAWEISWVPQFRIDEEGGLWLP